MTCSRCHHPLSLHVEAGLVCLFCDEFGGDCSRAKLVDRQVEALEQQS